MTKKKVSTLLSWEDVNKKLKELCDLTVQKRDVENLQTEEITKIKEKWETKVQEITKKMSEIEKDIILFSENNRNEFLKKRSKKLTFGTISFRATRKITIKNIVSAILALKSMNMDSYIRKTESIDKEALLGLSDNELAPLLKAGITVKREDKITIEPDIIELATIRG